MNSSSSLMKSQNLYIPLTSRVNDKKLLKEISSNNSDTEELINPLTDITHKINMAPISTSKYKNEINRSKRSLSTNVLTKKSPMNCTIHGRCLFREKTYLQFHKSKTSRMNSPRDQSLYAKYASNYTCYSPAQYATAANKRKSIMKAYFRKRKELKKKYASMLGLIRKEELSAVQLAIIKVKKEKLENRLADIKQDYSMTKNLLEQQKLIEEEELVEEYKKIFKGEITENIILN